MGKPAARVGDMTAHGGSIVGPGVPTVLIGGMPAAVVGDNHLCPMLNPGTPPPPHVGGPIMPPGAVMVMIGGKPAACVGDMATCSGPPDSIIPPGCPTVLIGGGGGGGGGGTGQAGGGTGGGAGESEAEGHYIEVSFEDKGGKPIGGVAYAVKTPDNNESTGTLAGKVKKSGIPSGSCEIALKAIVKASWSEKKAAVGDKVKLIAETAGIDSGEKALLEIFIRDANYADNLLTQIESQVDGDKIEEEWILEIDKKYLSDGEDKSKIGRYSYPSFYFIAHAGGYSARAPFLEYKDYIEITVKDAEGHVIPNKKYKVILPNGAIKEGRLDNNGYAKVEGVPPGKAKVVIDPPQ